MGCSTRSPVSQSMIVLLVWLVSTSCALHEPKVPQTPPRAEPSPTLATTPSVRIAEGGRTRLVIRAPLRLLVDEAVGSNVTNTKPAAKAVTPAQKAAEGARKELAAAVRDLARYLGRVIGAEVAVEPGPAAEGDDRLPILVAELARDRLGPIQGHTLGGQSFRVVVSEQLIGLYGESDLAHGYAIYELLDRVGCRWYMPGELGEVIPTRPTLSLPVADEELAPSTLYRGVWYADADYKRRNRLGGVQLAAGHKLEAWITADQRSEHPNWRAQVGGAPHASRLRWSAPELPLAIAASIEAELEKRPADSVSLSPGDGMEFDEVDDVALDAGDFDPSVNGVSLTDRLVVLVNRVAQQLEPHHPETLLGVLAYASYTRPPVREKLHRNVVPVIAPITYCRTRPWSDARCPGASDVRRIVQGWSERARLIAYRGYVFNLSEPSAPNPMLRKWSDDMSFLLSQNMRFYQPETFPSFETNLPALYLGIRLGFRKDLEPSAVLDELFRDFYGAAAPAVRAYSEHMDHAWLQSTDFAGGNLAYASRFTPDIMREARRLMDRAKQASATPVEEARVAMLDASLAQFERYMGLITRLRVGDLAGLGADYLAWFDEAGRLADTYAPNSAFGKAGWAGPNGIYANYAHRFAGPSYLEADRIGREERVLTEAPLCRFTYAKVDAKPSAPAAPAPVAGAEATDVCFETWSRLGLYDYFGSVRYQASVEGVKPSLRGNRVWLSRVDGVASVWVNGQKAKALALDPKKPADEAHLTPLTFDVSGLIRAGSNDLVVVVERTRLSELGAGGLLGPVYLYGSR